MTKPEAVADAIHEFMKARDWEQFYSPKNLAMALAGEVGELVAEFQWLTEAESYQARVDGPLRNRVSMELADVAIYLRLLADAIGVDLTEVVEAKLVANDARYPAEEVRGSASKRPGV